MDYVHMISAQRMYGMHLLQFFTNYYKGFECEILKYVF